MNKLAVAELLSEWMQDNCYPLHADGMLGEDPEDAVDALLDMLEANGYTLGITA